MGPTSGGGGGLGLPPATRTGLARRLACRRTGEVGGCLRAAAATSRIDVVQEWGGGGGGGSGVGRESRAGGFPSSRVAGRAGVCLLRGRGVVVARSHRPSLLVPWNPYLLPIAPESLGAARVAWRPSVWRGDRRWSRGAPGARPLARSGAGSDWVAPALRPALAVGPRGGWAPFRRAVSGRGWERRRRTESPRDSRRPASRPLVRLRPSSSGLPTRPATSCRRGGGAGAGTGGQPATRPLHARSRSACAVRPRLLARHVARAGLAPDVGRERRVRLLSTPRRR